MITETILGVLIDVVLWLVNTILSLLPAAPTFEFPVPRVLWELVEIVFSAAMSFFTAGLIWWIWRQVKS